MAKKTTYEYQITENIFMGIELPKYELLKVNLVQKVSIGTQSKKKIEVSRVHDYVLDIDVKNIDDSLIEELSKNLQDLFNLKFPPYNWKDKSYHYYTTRFQDESVKKSQLEQIFEYLHEFENKYKQKVEVLLEVFNEDVIDKVSYKDFEIAVKYNQKLNAFVVLCLSYLGAERFKILAKSSIEKGKFNESNIEPDFFDDLVKFKQKILCIL